MEVFMIDRALPPYLCIKRENSDWIILNQSMTTQGSNLKGEADAAAGSMLHRVSSFNILRTPNSRSEKKEKKEVLEINESLVKTVEPTWRLKDKMKTVGVGLIMALNVGTDPPDIIKPHPCAKLQCWLDPSSISRSKAKEKIGENLEFQYAQWQQQRGTKAIKYRRALDPTVEDVRSLCLGLRRQARSERVLLHYNGHGVPRPTVNGEIWVFDKNHTQYIPLCVTDMRQWIGKPTIIVLDCSTAGILMPYLTAPIESSDSTPSQTPDPSDFATYDIETAASMWVRETIVLAPTSDKECLPMHPDYPADIFTSCLTTPIKVALRWFIRRNPQSMGDLDPDIVDAIPGKSDDRKTPLGELNWIFTSVTDSIAWNVLPKPLFQRLFRQDLLVASMFRNFLLADRILRSLNCTPQSYPPLPQGICNHPLWQAWDLACETSLCALIRDGILNKQMLVVIPTDGENDADDERTNKDNKTEKPVEPVGLGAMSSFTSPFFSEQLTAFEIWLEFALIRMTNETNGTFECPEQLPIVLQVLLSQAHRVKALTLLRQFLDLGSWAVNLALSVGIFPYVSKLLQSPEYKLNLIGIWARILSFDSSCQVDLVKDGALPHFIQHLSWGLNRATMNLPLNPVEAAEQRTMAALILSIACKDYSQGQIACMQQNLHGTCCTLLSSVEAIPNKSLDSGRKGLPADERVPPRLRTWLCICLGNFFKGNVTTQIKGFHVGAHLRLIARLNDDSPEVRAAACYALSCLLSTSLHPNEIQASRLSPFSPSPQQVEAPYQSINLRSNHQTNNVVQHQIMHSQILPTGSNFSGRLQPSFVSSANGTHLWNPHQLPYDAPVSMQNGHMGRNTSSQGSVYNDSPIRSQINNSTLISHEYLQQDNAHISTDARLTAFEDSHRLALDLTVAMNAVSALDDGSAMVRYEVVILIAVMLDKYLQAFLSASEEMTISDSRVSKENVLVEQDDEKKVIHFPFPLCLNPEMIEKFRAIWKAIRNCHHHDAHPSVLKAASSIVNYVHENVLKSKVKLTRERLLISNRISLPFRTAGASSDYDLSRFSSPKRSSLQRDELQGEADSTKAEALLFRRTISVLGMSHTPSTPPNPAEAFDTPSRSNIEKIEYNPPESELFDWMSRTFFMSENAASNYDSMDSLSPQGALNAYLSRRNQINFDFSEKVFKYYSCLAPKPPKSAKEKYSNELFLEENEAATQIMEECLNKKRTTLELKQIGLLRNTNALSTSLIKFHPFEDIIAVCDEQSGISIWDSQKFNKVFSIRNGNIKGSRFTSTCWMNAESTSIFVAGCDDGSVRAWGGIPFSKSEPSQSVALNFAFFALPGLIPDKSKSGLILDWEQNTGHLVAGGNSSMIRIWDMYSQTCCQEISTSQDACVTTLVSAGGTKFTGNRSCTEPHQLIAGFSDGTLKMFDTRIKTVAINVCTPLHATGKRRFGVESFKEHGGWIVDASLLGYDQSNSVSYLSQILTSCLQYINANSISLDRFW
jgi:WD40 repeat protein